MTSKPISASMTLLIPLLFVLGVASAPPTAAEPLVSQSESVLGVCTSSVCVPPLAELLHRAPMPMPMPMRLSDQSIGDVGCSELRTLDSADPRPFAAVSSTADIPPRLE
ncbi:hypothetical protein OH799_14520 [Nocardia sp. NBC_00881]|uniref:hypothetical protein n=1 Tax=Nocardia sp. NBC_00881 TaxID=2975995 RepID=UPI0038705796|nr:hypothetical protein OH799_14520 [Nocardia sp. NBC_00881]